MGSLRSMRKIEKSEIKKPEVEVCNVSNPKPFTATVTTVTNHSGPTTSNSYTVYVDSSNVATTYNFWVYNHSTSAWTGAMV
jgi:hypothetical protein